MFEAFAAKDSESILQRGQHWTDGCCSEGKCSNVTGHSWISGKGSVAMKSSIRSSIFVSFAKCSDAHIISSFAGSNMSLAITAQFVILANHE